MNSLRLWSVVLAAAWFLAGFAAGRVVSAKDQEKSPLSRYAQRLSEDFDLSGLRRDALIQVLEQDQRDRAAVRRKYELASRDAMEPDLRELDEKLEDTIRNTILPPAERDRYDQLRRPIELTAAR